MTSFLAEVRPTLRLESMDGSVVIPLDNSTGWIRMPGSTGLRMPPREIITTTTPGVPGSRVEEVRDTERPIFIPIYCGAPTSQLTFQGMLNTLQNLVGSPTREFKVVGATAWGTRELVVTYESGLEGADGEDSEGLSWCKIGLKATAHFPYARAQTEKRLEYRFSSNAAPFIGVVGGTDATWPTMLSSASVIGSDMSVIIDSEVEVYPNVELIGPMSSFVGTLSPVVTNPDGSQTVLVDQEWIIDVPAGVAAGSTMKIVTDPRQRSIRYNGGLAAGRIKRGSSLRPFYPGKNLLDVTAPGGTSATMIIITWVNLYRSLW